MMTKEVSWADLLDYLDKNCNESNIHPYPYEAELYCQLLWMLCEMTAAKTVIEIGIGPTSASGATFIHSLSKRNGKLISIDIDPSRPKQIHKDLAKDLGVAWTQIYGDSLSESVKVKNECDILYIDGDHDFANALGDTLKFLQNLRDGGFCVIDDYPAFGGVSDAKIALEEKGLKLLHFPHHPPDGNGRLVFQK